MQAITGVEGSFEQFLADKASIMRAPIGANLELIPVCNMDCRMCYVRTDMKEVNRLGGLPDHEMWLRLGREMKDMGTLFVLLTGGEPLLHPYFKEIYSWYHELGFILTVNTNGTLIDEEWADFFSQYPPRRMNITIYGKDNETYDRLCCNPKGFDQLSRGIKLLQNRDIPIRLNCSLTKYNYSQWDELREIAAEWKIPLVTAYYMMPPGRKITHSGEAAGADGFFQLTQANQDGLSSDSSVLKEHASDKSAAVILNRHDEVRLSPEEAAVAAWDVLTVKMTEQERFTYAVDKLREVDEFVPDKVYKPGYPCRAGSSSFWVKWDGSFTSCGMLGDREFNYKKETLPVLWEMLKERTAKTCLSASCTNCRLQSLCPHCASSEYTENGAFGREPEYLCRFARAFYEVIQEKKSELEGDSADHL